MQKNFHIQRQDLLLSMKKSVDELIINAILEVDYGQSSAEDALTSLAQKLNENIASNYQ